MEYLDDTHVFQHTARNMFRERPLVNESTKETENDYLALISLLFLFIIKCLLLPFS